MKLENQVSSLEPSRRLSELGVKQESAFYWETTVPFASDFDLVQSHERNFAEGIVHYSAYTVAELGVALPNEIDMQESLKTSSRWWAYYFWKGLYDETYQGIQAEKEADTCSQRLIYLIEKNIVDVADINKRLRATND